MREEPEVVALRAVFEGLGRDPSAHMRASQRLRSEWPALWDAITSVVYDPDERVMAIPDSTESDLGKFLDEAIEQWDRILNSPDSEYHSLAPFYIDAFSLIRERVGSV